MYHFYLKLRDLLHPAFYSVLFISMIQPELHAQATQSATITGTILNETGDGLVGVNIAVAEQGVSRTINALSKEKGLFTVGNLQVGKTYDFTFSYVGFDDTYYKNFVVKANGNGNSILIRMRAKDNQLNEVVVTALGIKRDEKALGYAAQTVNSEEINDARSNNFINALSGKVAGLNMVSPGSGPLNSVRVSLRGDASLNPEGNNALIVIDGVPVNNSITSSGVGNAYQAGSGNDVPIDFGNGISDINPDDIESITVLKGAAATALYGSRAGNGALLITTKSGNRKGKGIGVTVNTNISMNDVLRWPDYQYEYGQGTGRQFNSAGEMFYSYGAGVDGPSTSGTSSAYGPRFAGQEFFQYDPVLEGRGTERTPWRPYTDNIKGFWRTGFTISNNVSLEGGNKDGNARLSVTHTKNEWIMPNTGFERITAATSFNYKISDKLKINSKINFTHKQSDNLPATGYNNQSIAYFMIFQNPNVDLDWYRPVWRKDFNQIDQVHPFSSFIDNPFLIAHEMTNSVSSNQVVGAIWANYNINSHLDLMVRTGADLGMEDRQQRRPFSTANFQRGYFKEQSINYLESNTDALLTYKGNISQNLSISASAGANAMIRRFNRLEAYVNGLVIPGVYKLANGIGNPITNVVDRNKNVNSVYGLVNLNYKDKVYVDLTSRNDWSSTLSQDNWSFFYPSLSTSFVLSEIFTLPKSISFAKLRTAVAEVGNDTDPYRTKKYYGNSDFPSSGTAPTTLHNINFKPEISRSFEIGTDVRMFNNRLGIDLTYYNNITENQILDVPLDPTTGFTRAVMNGGKIRNRGVELILNVSPVKSQQFKWNTTLTWARNVNRVLELTEGIEDRQDIGYGGNATVQARVGGTVGDIYGFGFVRSPEGAIIYNANGLPQRPQEISFQGTALPDFRAGLRNEFQYKNWRLSFLFDGQLGGIVYSQSHHKMSEQGKLTHTLRGREENFIIGDGVVLDSDGKYIPNTTRVLPVDYYFEYYRRANVESNSFDASFIKLREARIEFNFPKSLLGSKIFQQLTIALYGRDLLMWTSFPVFDPETAALNGSTILPGIEMGQLPTPRTFGANFTFKF